MQLRKTKKWCRKYKEIIKREVAELLSRWSNILTNCNLNALFCLFLGTIHAILLLDILNSKDGL
jgi:methylthioribose-1-phosphate isomerase